MQESVEKFVTQKQRVGARQGTWDDRRGRAAVSLVVS